MYLTHLIKQIVGVAATPPACGFLMAVTGTIIRLFGRRRTAAALWTGAALLLYLSSIGPVANALLRPLEVSYPPLADAQILPSVHFIAVLGNGYAPRDGIPITAALPLDGLARITEGVRLLRLLPGAKLVVSGGAIGDEVPPALGYAKFAQSLGVEQGAIVKLDQALDTSDEARGVAALVGDSAFYLVTSAYHMRRAMRLMQHAGAHPIPAPTGQLASLKPELAAGFWVPNSASLRKTEAALHEYLGLVIAN